MGPQNPKDVARDLARDLYGNGGGAGRPEGRRSALAHRSGYMQTCICAWGTPTLQSRRH